MYPKRFLVLNTVSSDLATTVVLDRKFKKNRLRLIIKYQRIKDLRCKVIPDGKSNAILEYWVI